MMDVVVIALDAFAEAIFFPIPPDAFLVAYSIASPKNWFIYALVASLSSALGGALGYYIGNLFKSLTKQLLGKRLKEAEAFYSKYGSYAIALAGFTPIPYKVFTLSSGFLSYPFLTFFLISLAARSLRFFAVSYLSAVFGEEALSIINDPKLLALASFIAIMVLYFAFLAAKRIKRN